MLHIKCLFVTQKYILVLTSVNPTKVLSSLSKLKLMIGPCVFETFFQSTEVLAWLVLLWTYSDVKLCHPYTFAIGLPFECVLNCKNSQTLTLNKYF